MELLKLDDRPAEYQWGDVTFLFRTKVTVGDKYAIDSAGVIVDKDKISFARAEFYKAIIQVFVKGWKGVTENGVEAPYSYEAMMTRLPSSTTDDVVMNLGYHIAKTNGFIKGEEKGNEEQKNA